MDLATIEAPAAEARRKFLEYRRAVRERHDDEDAQIMRGYRELAKGARLIRLTETVRAGGTTTLPYRNWNGREEALELPRLAVCRADAQVVWCNGINQQGGVEIRDKREVAVNNRRNRRVFHGLFGEDLERCGGGWWTSQLAKAIVPNVPPAFRPARGLANLTLLFEAEWGLDPEPPVDPALLKPIGGDLYAVVAVWDLTELERAVLAGRAAP